MDDLWEHAARAVRETGRAVLVVVVDHAGSVPGTTGAAMVVSDLGCTGTVGGGVAEHRAIEHARRFHGPPELVEVEHTAEGSGSLCSGRQTMAVLDLGRGDLEVLEAITAALAAGGHGALHLGSTGVSFSPADVPSTTFQVAADGFSFETVIGDLDTLYLFGGGHVSLALCRVMATLPFRLVVLDDRPDLPTMVGNPFAGDKRVVDYRTAAAEVDEGERSWAVIMTHGHANDALVLAQLVPLRLRYLGMLGSASKVRRLFDRLRGDGVPEELLERVRAPVGLDISSHTPAEIAVSIAAEIIREKNTRAPAAAPPQRPPETSS